MRVGLMTWGTEGDIRPFFALAATLRQRGHDVQLAYVNVEGRDLAHLGTAVGVDSQSVCAGYFRAQRERISDHARKNFRIANPIKQLDRILADTLDPVVDEMFTVGRQLAARSDLVITHFLAHPVVSAAEAEQRPFACLAFAPVFPTRHHPPMGAPRLGRLLNPALWWVANRAMDSILAARVNHLRQREGLSVEPDVSAQLLRNARLLLLAVSPILWPRPDDWDARIEQCGFLELREAGSAGELEAPLRNFLDAGAAPAFFSLGSMANLEEARAAAAVRAMVEATTRLGVRAVVQAPAAALVEAPQRDDVYYLSRAPHALLFPRCSVIVHHGGAGTTHAALRAGRPSIIVPHIGDQFFWADTLKRHGVASAPLRAHTLDAKRLESRLRDVLSRPDMITRAEALGARLREEQGATLACTHIERLEP